jgi:hypothetical protein
VEGEEENCRGREIAALKIRRRARAATAAAKVAVGRAVVKERGSGGRSRNRDERSETKAPR